MPIYEYQCEHCGKVVEVYGQTMAQAGPPASCPCGRSSTFVKLYSSFASHSSGTGSPPDMCCGGEGECVGRDSAAGCCGGHCGHRH